MGPPLSVEREVRARVPPSRALDGSPGAAALRRVGESLVASSGAVRELWALGSGLRALGRP